MLRHFYTQEEGMVNYLNYNQASLYTGLSDRTLKRSVSTRELTHIKLGRRTLFRRTDLDNYVIKNIFALGIIWLGKYEVAKETP